MAESEQDGTIERSDPPAHSKKTGRALPVDLRVLEYVNGYDRNLMCPICHCPLIEGTKLPCDHTFCKQCVTRALQSQEQETKTCPSCRASVSRKDMTPVPRFIRDMVDDLLARCPHHEEGCVKTVRRGDIQYHADVDCAYAEVECPLPSCGLRIPRRLYGSDCLHQYAECDFCHEQLMKRDLDVHSNELCKVREWPCPYCHADITANSRMSHAQECLQAAVVCAGSEIGCAFADKRIAVHTHQRSCPMALMLPAFSSLVSRLEQQNAATDSLRQRNTVLENGLERLRTLVDTCQLPSSPAPVRSSEDNLSSATTARESAVVDAPFDSATHHLLSLHETLRDELERVSGSVTELDARASLMIMNENLRLKEDMAHLNAVVSSMRMQLQWLMSARLQAQQRPSPAAAMQGATGTIAGRVQSGANAASPEGPIRRLSDSSTKL